MTLKVDQRPPDSKHQGRTRTQDGWVLLLMCCLTFLPGFILSNPLLISKQHEASFHVPGDLFQRLVVGGDLVVSTSQPPPFAEHGRRGNSVIRRDHLHGQQPQF